jgi:hypothetical protein
MKKALTLLLAIVAFFPFYSIAQQQTAVSYSLFHPVPKEKMRKMATDRPGITESPFTIDAGHYQFETDLLSFEKSTTETTDQNTILLNHFNFKLGLTNNLSLQLGLESYGIQKQTELASGMKQTSKGIGNINIRIKRNILGNTGGAFTMAILPYINIPTARYESDGRMEGGLLLPMELKLPNKWKLSMQLEGDRLKDKEVNALHTQFLQSLTIERTIIKGLDGMAESYYTYNFKDKSWANYLDGALQYSFSKNVKVDVGLNYGLQADAEKTYYLGMAFRF